MNRRPELTIIAPGASAEEAAAVVAALEQFMRATAPVRATPAGGAQSPAAAPPSAWLAAAIAEGVARHPGAAPYATGGW